MAASRAPKQWPLTKQETITSFEGWRQNLQYILSLDPNFAPFLVDGFTWLKKTSTTPLRGLTNDGEDVREARRRTAEQKTTHLELLLGQIANFCPVISRNTIIKNCTSLKSIWQAIRLHYGFQSTGAHFLDFDKITLEAGERPEDLFQRLNSFVEDSLLKHDGNIHHHGDIPVNDEDLTPSLENFIVLTWLRLIDKNLPSLVKQKYGTELRSKTLASLKPEISQALDSLLEELHASAEARVLRTSFKSNPMAPPTRKSHMQHVKPYKNKRPVCPLCKQANRTRYDHFLSKCKYLPDDDREYLSRVRQTCSIEFDDLDSDDNLSDQQETESSYQPDTPRTNKVSSLHRVSTKQSPFMKVFYKHHPLQVTLDTGAEISMIKNATANYIGARITKSNQNALQADGITPLKILGETRLCLSRGSHDLELDALVVDDMDVDILAGIPFMSLNDISVRPSKQQILIGDHDSFTYGCSIKSLSDTNSVRRTQAYVLRQPNASTVVWPGDYIELDIPKDVDQDSILAIDSRQRDRCPSEEWPKPGFIESISGKVRIVNDTLVPQDVKRHEHFCQVTQTSPLHIPKTPVEYTPTQPRSRNVKSPSPFSSTVQVDPDNILHVDARKRFSSLLETYDSVFDPNITGYNGYFGHFESVVNMGPTQPPQRKGRLPLYAKHKLVELQDKFDELEKVGVFKKPEELDVNVEYLNPSFLVKKPNGGYRLVTAFADVGRYSKPQPSLMPDVDSTLRSIAQWKYIITSDLTSAFYQIPLSKNSMKYCGVVTPYRGVRVYAKCAMGMPGSETALEELMSRVLGDCLKDGIVAKLADDLYCGGNSLDEVIMNWERVLNLLHKSNIRLSAHKTIICPARTTILGWIWSNGNLSASPHRIATLSQCPRPETVNGLRSFLGAYKMLSRVLPNCSQKLSAFENVVSARQSHERIMWSDELIDLFAKAQSHLKNNKTITLPRPEDELWIVTDGSVSKKGIGATLYISRSNKLYLSGFFSAKLRKHQVNWLPCEVEALCIAAAIKHFSPYIIQSVRRSNLLTDSKPCVQAVDKLCRGEFSTSPRITSFLSTVSQYQLSIQHLSGSANVPSDFASRNAPDCDEPRCQVCTFIVQLEDGVVRSIRDFNSLTKVPFTTRSAWLDIQSSCPDLRRVCAHLRQGTRPSKKLTKIKDIKRYLNIATISKDNLLVVRKSDPLTTPTELIIVPRSVIDGLVTAMHIKLGHPSKHQLELVMKRSFYALDLSKTISHATATCHLCTSIKTLPDSFVEQTTDIAPESVGLCLAADVVKRNKQLILVVRETVTSFTRACFIENERHDTLCEALIHLCLELHPLSGPLCTVRVDPAPGFASLRDDKRLSELGICLEVGRIKNINKNPVAEKAIRELEDEILRIIPGGGPITRLNLDLAVAHLNSRLRNRGLSSREMWTQRDQFTHKQLPISDLNLITEQFQLRSKNHPYSEKSKNRSSPHYGSVSVGDLVYLRSDKSKLHARKRYLVVSNDGEWCTVKKFVGDQLRATSYKVKEPECYKVPPTVTSSNPVENNSDDEGETTMIQPAVPLPPVPDPLYYPPEVVVHNTDYIDYSTSVTPSETSHTPVTTLTDPDQDFRFDRDIVSESATQQSMRPKRVRRPPSYFDDYELSQ